MTTAHIAAAAPIGFEGALIDVECNMSNSLPGIVIVGMGNKAIDEAKERIRSAITNSKLNMPPKRITLNLAPADLPKDGTSYDLPLALAILTVSKQISATCLSDTLTVGELALDGSIRPVRGIVSYAEIARRSGMKRILVPTKNVQQAALVNDIEVIPVSSLYDVYHFLRSNFKIQPATPKIIATRPSTLDFADIAGQKVAKRALEIAASGNHNILLTGPPGTGKSLLASATASILPPPSTEEILAITKLHSIAGESVEKLITQRPYRNPHHSASHIALVGGGRKATPGEISLAHRGVLFMDELPEYSRQCLESLRQPLEDKQVTISRAEGTVTYPADFMLIATQNPCPCGFYGDQERSCSCTEQRLFAYQNKLSGPLLDRIDLVVNVDRIDHTTLLKNAKQETSTLIQSRVVNARLIQSRRLKSVWRTNSHLTTYEIKQSALLDNTAKELLDKASKRLFLSPRAYMRTIKVARTIADIEHSLEVKSPHIAEALQYRHRNHE